jgi:hypothetical protein
MSQVTSSKKPEWTLGDLHSLPPTIPAQQADAIIGMSASTGYRMRAEGTYPVPWLTIGRHHRVLTAPLLTLLGLPTGDLSGLDGSMPVRLADEGGLVVEEGAA